MQKYQRNLVTAALPYANGPVHIGQIAGAYLPADIYVRYLRAAGEDVAFICGSDEHGAAITIQAKREGIPPKEIVDKYHAINKAAFEGLGIKFDIFHRTTAPIHHETAAAFFEHVADQGYFDVKETEQLYDEEYNQFLADRYVTGTCPRCANAKAYGDQCEKCGSTLSPTDLIDPVSTLSGNPPVLRSTKHWFFQLDRFQQWLETWLVKGEGREENWKRNVMGAVKSWLDDGLRARSVTRDLDWGVQVPLEGGEGKVLYVWFDAPIGYISATRQWAADHDKDWKAYWQSPDSRLVHFLGKDNIVFHCIIFPSMLKAHGDYILPANVPANEFMNMEGDKLSTSRNWAIWVPEYLEEFPDKQDVLRYVLCANLPETKDSEFTWKDYQARNNNELVATFGNFVNRVMVLSHKYYKGVVPAADLRLPLAGATKDGPDVKYADVLVELTGRLNNIGGHIRAYRMRDAQREMMEIASYGNSFLQFNEPWKLQKTDPEQVKTVMFTALQIVGVLSHAAEPFIPFTAARMRRMLNLPALADGHLHDLIAGLQAGNGKLICADSALGEPILLFTKIDDKLIAEQLAKLADIKAAQTDAQQTETEQHIALKSRINYEDFSKLDIRTGTIVSAEKMEGADKLLVLKVDIGQETRTVASGIALDYAPEDLPGQRVLLLANLAPRKLRGVESDGMILMADDENGKPVFVLADEGTPNGMQIS